MLFRNTLLRALDPEDLADIVLNLREANLSPGQVLCEPGELPTDVYFPSSAVISIVTLLDDGRAFEVSSIGYEGVVNAFPALTDIPPATRAFVQLPGTAFRLPIAALRNQLEGRPALMRRFLAYLQVSSGQAERTIACNASHPLSARLARWLLISNDRVDSPVMMLTQDYMSVMTGALRGSVSLTASAYKRDGLIDYKRGRVEILDRPGLERRACECYRADQADLSQILGAP